MDGTLHFFDVGGPVNLVLLEDAIEHSIRRRGVHHVLGRIIQIGVVLAVLVVRIFSSLLVIVVDGELDYACCFLCMLAFQVGLTVLLEQDELSMCTIRTEPFLLKLNLHQSHSKVPTLGFILVLVELRI